MSAFTLAFPVYAQSTSASSGPSYPSRPIRFLVGFVAGGNSDLIARALSLRMSQAMGQQVIVDNRPGANGGIARGMVAQSARDGYTITIIGPSTLVFGEVTHRTDYDPMREFAPLARVGEYQNILITHPAVPVHTLADYIALAKAQPGKINYATSGVGGAGHMAMELLRSMTHIHVTHVPYKGGGSAINDLIAGQVESFMAIVSTSIPHIQSGKARALAVTGSRRAAPWRCLMCRPSRRRVSPDMKRQPGRAWWPRAAPCGRWWSVSITKLPQPCVMRR